MSTSPVSSTSLTEQQYFQTRQGDLQQLGQALASGNASGAESAFNNIVALGKNGPFQNGDPFAIAQREQDFTNIGQALQSGDLAGAQQAFTSLKNTFNPHPSTTPNSPSSSGAGPEIVLNLSNTGSAGSPEQVTINIANAASGGGEQISISAGSQGSNPQQLTFNIGANSNEQIVLNLLNGASSGGSSGDSTSGGLSVSA